MKKGAVGIGIASIAALIGAPAFAADMAVKARPQVSVVAARWTGFYGGFNAGAAWASTQFGWNSPGPAAAILADSMATLHPAGFAGGGQIGYNYQINSLVLGAEADIDYTDLSASRQVPTPPFANQVNEAFTSHWLATFRGRLGYSTDRILIYATGGLALAQTKLYDALGFNAETASTDRTKAGWTAGGGVEWAVDPKWSVKAEYLYVDLGSVNFSQLTDAAGVAIDTGIFGHKMRENIARVGLNYRLN
jgi:outer membrane immunogenic protein